MIFANPCLVRYIAVGCMLTLANCTYNEAEESIMEGPVVKYSEDIKPIIETHCYSCHSASATDPDKPGYAFLDNFDELKRYALKPSTTDASYTTLQARIRFIEFPGMPFKRDPLIESDIKKIELWIKAGAPNN